ncbi:lysophospholipid acyltransferase family protein [Catenovulum sp. SM1970]|uniref:GNAT family N-acyltransferase n=1 Tax=Marinifaba aquimaris TaxID=2741323 RepID=UPI001573A3E4|nr:lysophospholipid acyltransferase family protein [Marinifaba aquimaris]NTS77668.1 lysophospholipid acyltransferase family protein [Marinifaba aquimaris]
MINIDAVLDEKLPKFSNKHPIARTKLASFLKYLFHESEFHAFEEKYPHLEGFDFVEQVLNYFDFGYRVFDREMERIPSEGRVVIVANHPIGSLDGLALLKLVREVRPDVRVIANDLLYAIEPLRSLLIPVDNMSNKTRKNSIKNIRDWLKNEGAVIIFPAGEVSRFGPSGLKDGRWNSGFIRFAQSTNSPILPLFVNGRNSLFFYALSLLAKPISTLWLVREMFKQSNRHIDVRVGHLVQPEQYKDLELNLEAKAKLFKKYVYKLAKGKVLAGFEPEYEAVAHPESSQQLKKEISQCELLGETSDGKKIYLYQYQTNSVVMREIGRLREMTFRTVKEGSGKRRDVDSYDNYYDHIILWDEQDLEIVGAYRMVRTRHAFAQEAEKPLYTQTLFDFQPAFNDKLINSLELGRSFVQPKYWGKRSLDYLWFGIGAYLRKYPDLEYMFGPVSISATYSDKGKNLLTHFYSQFFGTEQTYVIAPNEYKITDKKQAKLDELYQEAQDYKSRFTILKSEMAKKEESVPTLLKQYTEVVEEGGIEFAAFNVDHEFSDCIDGFIVVDISKLKASKKKRYIG